MMTILTNTAFFKAKPGQSGFAAAPMRTPTVRAPRLDEPWCHRRSRA